MCLRTGRTSENQFIMSNFFVKYFFLQILQVRRFASSLLLQHKKKNSAAGRLKKTDKQKNTTVLMWQPASSDQFLSGLLHRWRLSAVRGFFPGADRKTADLLEVA